MVTIKSGTWFEVRYKYDKTTEDGMMKKATETSVFLADNFKDAYEKTTEYLYKYMSGEFDVVGMKIAPYTCVIQSEDGEYYYRVKVSFISLDEKSGKEKKIPCSYLVEANNVEQARRITDDYCTESMYDTEIESVFATKITDVLYD